MGCKKLYIYCILQGNSKAIIILGQSFFYFFLPLFLPLSFCLSFFLSFSLPIFFCLSELISMFLTNIMLQNLLTLIICQSVFCLCVLFYWFSLYFLSVFGYLTNLWHSQLNASFFIHNYVCLSSYVICNCEIVCESAHLFLSFFSYSVPFLRVFVCSFPSSSFSLLFWFFFQLSLFCLSVLLFELMYLFFVCFFIASWLISFFFLSSVFLFVLSFVCQLISIGSVVCFFLFFCPSSFCFCFFFYLLLSLCALSLFVR